MCDFKRVATIGLLATSLVAGATEKLEKGYHNPIADYMFCADPTCVEYEGRLYVYGTNDSQQLELSAPGAENTYEKIHSFQVMSTEDMVNWTYHGIIDILEAAPKGLGISWAPSIVSRKEQDGQTHFYMFFSSSGSGVGEITATSPLGPWHDPLDREFVNYKDPAIGDCPNPFDPGVMIDDNGVGWLAFGAGIAKDGNDYFTGSQRIVRLADDMIHPASDYIEIKAPYHFEANELNYIGGKYVYIYNTSWKDRTQWDLEGKDAPTRCAMSYMTSTDPLNTDSWQYQGLILRNPGDEGLEYSNNHTHLHKYKGEWYMFYHTLTLQKSLGVNGGYRSICVDKIKVDESTAKIRRCKMTREGVAQLQLLDVAKMQSAATSTATNNIVYEPTDVPGEMVVHATAAGQGFSVSGVHAGNKQRKLAVNVKGSGTIALRRDNPDGAVLATVKFHSDDWTVVDGKLTGPLADGDNLCFTFEDGDFLFKEWQIK
jgi:hypothetical protein